MSAGDDLIEHARRVVVDLEAKLRDARVRVDRLEIALHRIAGHGNITGEKAREIAADALATLD